MSQQVLVCRSNQKTSAGGNPMYKVGMQNDVPHMVPISVWDFTGTVETDAKGF